MIKVLEQNIIIEQLFLNLSQGGRNRFLYSSFLLREVDNHFEIN